MKTTKVAETSLPTPLGTFRLFGFQSEPKTENVLALVMGKLNPDEAALVRIHSQCLTGDVFGSERCDCGDQLHFALSTIAESGSGLLIYQLQEGRGIGLMNKLLAYELQDSGHDTVEANEHLGFEADHRNYDLCAGVLRHFGITRVRLMTNNPQKFDALEAAGLLCDVECTWCDYRISKCQPVNRSFDNLVVETSTLHIGQQAI
ncbi:MAG: GTP cyclohydrolase II [Acidobacteria bacterium]|nr:MAG: GTP cyclohydrolase II [Acidobacteriota bacterium]